jgi:hypothetical protein
MVDDSTSMPLGVNIQNVMQLYECTDLLCLFIWSYVYGPMQFHDESDECAAGIAKILKRAQCGLL